MERTEMVTKSAKGAKLESKTTEVLAGDETAEQGKAMESLMNEPKAAKPAKVAKPVVVVDRLQMVIDAQTKRVDAGIVVHLTNRVAARVAAGQDEHGALAEVLG